jgi:serine/threonine kinase 32
MPCLHAISSLLEKNRSQRIGAIGFETFTDNPFFRAIDFEALENKEIEPVFRPSSEKTNFDATYDLEELLLEEAPLEARARRQKPREQLKDDATDAEIRTEELHKMIETLFEPFDYTLVSPEEAKSVSSETERLTPTGTAISAPEPQRPRTSHRENPSEEAGGLRVMTPTGNFANRSRSSTHSPNGSPPLPTVALDFQFTTTEREQRQREREEERERSYGIPNTHSAIPRSVPDEYHDYLKDSKFIPGFEQPPGFSAPSGQPNSSKRRRQTTTAGAGVGSGSRSISGSNMPPGPSEEPPLPINSGDERDPKRPSGMLGFLSRKKGRDRSPKAKERGVLGKDGARQIIGA